jgi:NitT/TauT family transport system substrate-binding protein
MPLVLQESLRGLLYLPYYAALTQGAYRAEGLVIAVADTPALGQAPRGLLAGIVDVAWGGPMRVNEIYAKRTDCDLVCFGEAVTRDPFMLIGREPCPDFTLAELYRRRVATVAEVPTPWLCLQEDLRREGLDPEALPRIADRTMAENAAALCRGEIDVVQLFQPFAEELITSGGHLWQAAAARGPTAYTSFYARRKLVDERRAEIRALVRALYRTQKWLHASPPEALAAAMQPFFPDLPTNLLPAAIARYATLGIWGRNPILPRSGYERLAAGLVSGGFVARAMSFEEVVDNSFAEAVIAEDPPPLGSCSARSARRR